jgi:polysaccharide biosynthesis/export protein
VRIFPVVSSPVRNRVVIRGDVWRPGTYQLDPGMKLTQLIADAGGLKPDAYLERAHIVRLNRDSTKVLIPVSLEGIPPVGAPDSGTVAPDTLHPTPYTHLVPRGNLAFDPDLREFDEVTVYSRTSFRPTRQIEVYGNVQHPGLFTFTDSMTLRDAVMMAGGLRDDAYLLEAEISRIPERRQPGQLAQVVDVPLDSSYVFDATGYLVRPAGPETPSPQLQPYDNVFIRRVPGWELQRNVFVTGEVKFPGRYTLLTQSDKVSDLVKRAGGLLPDAYAPGAQFYRAQGNAGRIGIDLPRVLRDTTYRDNMILFAGDSLYVPQFQSIVKVEGGVNSPVVVAYVPGKGTGYYIDRAGGFARRADKGRTYVVQPNGAVERRSATPQPGARIYVPEVPPGTEGTNWLQIFSTITGILTSTLTAILVAQRL